MNLQTAFDFIDLAKSLGIAEKVAPHSEWLEVGTSLIKSEGIRSVREFKARFPKNVIVADMKILDAGSARRSSRATTARTSSSSRRAPATVRSTRC